MDKNDKETEKRDKVTEKEYKETEKEGKDTENKEKEANKKHNRTIIVITCYHSINVNKLTRLTKSKITLNGLLYSKDG
jgi:hypothetical protein